MTLDVEKFVERFRRIYRMAHNNKMLPVISLAVKEAIAQDRKEREIEWFCKQCGHPNPIPASLPDPLAARLERQDKGTGICIMMRKGDIKIFRDGYRICEGDSWAAVQAALEEVERERVC